MSMSEANRPWVIVSQKVGAVVSVLFPKPENQISLEITVHGEL